jgi:hypothetical protein
MVAAIATTAILGAPATFADTIATPPTESLPADSATVAPAPAEPVAAGTEAAPVQSLAAPAPAENTAPAILAAPPVAREQSSTSQPPTANAEPPTGAIQPVLATAPAATPEHSAPAPESAAAPPVQINIPEPPKPVIEAAAPPPPPPPPPTPADLLGLAGKDRVKAEKCLANAVYFEARGEPLRGQIAVAQVVMNRVFSPYYPKDVCSVVYQNAERHLSCQFTFACDGKSKAIRERGAWWRAQRVARLTLDGKVWIAAVAKATHYHAYWVSPVWTAEMRKMYRFGVHTFYRPHRWGDGDKEAGWVQAPLPVLKPKPQPASNQPKPQATNVAPSTAAENAQAKELVPVPRPKPSATNKAANVQTNAKVNARSASTISVPKSSLARSAAKRATEGGRTKQPPAQSQVKPAQKITLN